MCVICRVECSPVAYTRVACNEEVPEVRCHARWRMQFVRDSPMHKKAYKRV